MGNKMKGKFMEVVLFIAALILCVVCGVTYLKREDTDYKKFADQADNLNFALKSLEGSNKKIEASLEKAMEHVDSIDAAIDDLMKRMVELERRGPASSTSPQTLNLHIKEPVSFNVVYSEKPKTMPDSVPPQISGKRKSSLLDKAGIRSHGKTFDQ